MPIYFNINYKGAGDLAIKAGVGRRVRIAAMTFANIQVAKYWHQTLMPNHFKQRAKRTYRHTKRTRTYSQIKRSAAQGFPRVDFKTGQVEKKPRKGGNVDIVHSGDAEKKVLSNSRAIRATAKSFTIRMVVPKYVVQRLKVGNRVLMKQELGRSSRQDADLLKKVWWFQYRTFLEANNVNQTIRIRR